MKIKHHTIAYDVLIRFVSFAKGITFHSVEENFTEGLQELETPYPSAILGNHVSEADIVALSLVYRRLNPKIKMIIPTREDILKPGFLNKEFRAKGILKWVFGLIDGSRLIPILMRYIGCVPVKRPFRDNSRELIKKGELRDQVDAEWTNLVTNIKRGKNLFMFPEGTYNQDGFLNQIKKGAYYLKTKIDTLHFNCFTLTYDSLSYKKSKLYIKYGKAFQLDPEKPVETITGIVKSKLGENYTITLGNLASFVLLKLGKETQLKKEKFINIIDSLRAQIQAQLPQASLASELSKSHFHSQLDTLLQKLKIAKLVELTEGGFKTLEELYQIPKSLHNLKKSNVVLYHRNQLTAHLESLDTIWNGILKDPALFSELNVTH